MTSPEEGRMQVRVIHPNGEEIPWAATFTEGKNLDGSIDPGTLYTWGGGEIGPPWKIQIMQPNGEWLTIRERFVEQTDLEKKIVRALAHDRATRWGYDTTLSPSDLGDWINKQAASFNTVEDVRAILSALNYERALYDAHERGWNDRGERDAASIKYLEEALDLAAKASKSVLEASEEVSSEVEKVTAQVETLREDNERLGAQINKLADFIMENLPGEIIRSEGAVDTAIRLLSGKIDVILPDGTHLYWSTHCRHAMDEEGHKKCQATEFPGGGDRQPSQCKTCAAPCRCECHKEVSWAEASEFAINDLIRIEERRADLSEREAKMEWTPGEEDIKAMMERTRRNFHAVGLGAAFDAAVGADSVSGPDQTA